MRKYKVKYDSYRLPIATKEYALAQVEEFLGPQYERDEWEEKAGEIPSRDRRIILYSARVARSSPREDRKDQLIQLCRKYSATQPDFWPRFLRERYQYAVTRDFFALDYNDIIWEYYAYDDECRGLEAEPKATGRVFDAAPVYRELMATVKKLTQQMTLA